MDGTLLIKESLFTAQRETPLMPHIGMDIESFMSRKAKTNEVLRLNIVTWQRQGHEIRLRFFRKEKLSAVGMVIRMP